MARRDDAPSIREIGDLVARLRRLTSDRDADSAERAAWLADKDALIARIRAANHRAAAEAAAAARAGGQDREPRDDEHTTDKDDGQDDDAQDDGEEWTR